LAAVDLDAGLACGQARFVGPQSAPEPDDDGVVGALTLPAWVFRIPGPAWLFIALAAVDVAISASLRAATFGPFGPTPTQLLGAAPQLVGAAAAVLLPAAVLIGRREPGPASRLLLTGAVVVSAGELLGLAWTVAFRTVFLEGAMGAPDGRLIPAAMAQTVSWLVRLILAVGGPAVLVVALTGLQPGRGSALPGRVGTGIVAVGVGTAVLQVCAELLGVSQMGDPVLGVQILFVLWALGSGAVTVAWALVARAAFDGWASRKGNGATWMAATGGAVANLGTQLGIAVVSLVLALGQLGVAQGKEPMDGLASAIIGGVGTAIGVLRFIGMPLLAVAFARGLVPAPASGESDPLDVARVAQPGPARARPLVLATRCRTSPPPRGSGGAPPWIAPSPTEGIAADLAVSLLMARGFAPDGPLTARASWHRMAMRSVLDRRRGSRFLDRDGQPIGQTFESEQSADRRAR